MSEPNDSKLLDWQKKKKNEKPALVEQQNIVFSYKNSNRLQNMPWRKELMSIYLCMYIRTERDKNNSIYNLLFSIKQSFPVKLIWMYRMLYNHWPKFLVCGIDLFENTNLTWKIQIVWSKIETRIATLHFFANHF